MRREKLYECKYPGCKHLLHSGAKEGYCSTHKQRIYRNGSPHDADLIKKVWTLAEDAKVLELEAMPKNSRGYVERGTVAILARSLGRTIGATQRRLCILRRERNAAAGLNLL